MPRFYFDVSNGRGFASDEEGVDLQDQAAALRMAMDSIRSILAEEVRKGVIDLDGYIEVRDDSAQALARIEFTEAFTLRLPAPGRERGGQL
ncbi:MAG: DUF6894 family protein [Novosphingobium sp.]